MGDITRGDSRGIAFFRSTHALDLFWFGKKGCKGEKSEYFSINAPSGKYTQTW